ncbi:MAG: leucine-rich repeat domain-containing protein [Verrucomicrobia subdivision 3 bacterium]|nr:leucine-rich repeat domain-containing protein [Limisphaerales bacterium]
MSKFDADIHKLEAEPEVESPKRGRVLLAFRIGLTGVLLLVGVGFWIDLQARRECEAKANDFFFLLQGPDVNRDEVHALMKREPDASEPRSREGDMVDDYIWPGVFFNYTMRLIYSREYGIYELVEVRSESHSRWGGESGVAEGDPVERVKFSNAQFEIKLREELRKPEGDITKTELLQLDRIDLAQSLVSDLKPVSQLRGLHLLILNNNHVEHLEPLESLTKLEVIYLRFNRIEDVSPLARLPQLRRLDLGDNRVADLEPLGRISTLNDLIIRNNRFTSIAPIARLKELRKLDASGNQIRILEPMGKLLRIESLDFSKNEISDIRPLENLHALEFLNLNDNVISDLSPLSKLKDIKILYLERNRITRVTALAGLGQLDLISLGGNPIPRSEVEALRIALPNCRIDF